MELFNAEQSTTDCDSGTCLNASRAIDGDWTTFSITYPATGNWLQVGMTNMTVYQVELSAGTWSSDEIITVSLYSGETLSGQCQSHSGYGIETLSCDRVAADRVRLSVSRTSSAYLTVGDIRVTTKTIGL